MSAAVSPASAAHRQWLDAELRRLLDFGRHVVHPLGGAAYLREDGTPDLERPLHTWITARMVHVYGLGAMLGEPGAREIAEGALRGLTGPLRDEQHGGWFTAVDAGGRVVGDGAKSCYDHAFVLLAASTAALAGLPGARELLADARGTFVSRFWDDRDGMCGDTWDRTWSTLDAYRGTNANMHAVEAMLATADVDGDEEWLVRASRIASRLVAVAEERAWRIPEHYTADWRPDLDYNHERPRDQFKPYGATVGHGLEWSRLLLQLEAATQPSTAESLDLLSAAESLFDRAVTDGWAVDGADGFVYTTDWEGQPIVSERMHWVVAEAIAAAAALGQRTDRPGYADWYDRCWDYARRYLIDHECGSWRHELDPQNRPAAATWPGKPDLYHAVQATLLPRLPLAPGLARAVHDGAPASDSSRRRAEVPRPRRTDA
ncbi:AGE family epimerase/isomerase [Cellulomonas sp. NPDC057328]|uniref:AGE family epimerase/isomerase n=1 Tax=Cellulomonas sp. NPDC057328 TaxID=3346101 RepID=UPI00362A771F